MIICRGQRCFIRLSLSQRIQHIGLIISFVVLVISGLPLVHPDSAVSAFIIKSFGSMSTRGIVHRAAALLLIAICLYHLIFVILSKRGRSDFIALIPRKRDLQDLFHQINYNLGRVKIPPEFDRFSWIEKFDYWAAVWGVSVMITTGFLLWFHDLAMSFLPKWALDVLRIIHSYEALLAVVAIITWHLYHVHLSPARRSMSRIWLTGLISEDDMKAHHPLEYERMIREDCISQNLRELELPNPRLRLKVGYFSFACLALIGITGFGVNMLKQPPKPHTCISCHGAVQVSPFVSSSHKELTCDKCHSDSTLVWTIVPKLGSQDRDNASAEGDFQESHGKVNGEVCKRCHSDIRDLVVYHSIKLSHQEHWNQKVDCLECHSGVVHGGKSGMQIAPDMQTCRNCHDSRDIPNGCESCHVTKAVRMAPASDKEWVDGHKHEASRKGQNHCSQCHVDDFCTNCHSRFIRHPSGWMKDHAIEHLKATDSCDSCHEQSFCSSCHTKSRPASHDRDWQRMHGIGTIEQCNNCHQASLCQKCHSSMNQAPSSHTQTWSSSHGDLVKAGKGSCDICHKQTWCTDCHGTKMPHPEGWVMSGHKEMASFQPDSTCAKCHQKQYCGICH